jgi:hypothetical protein
MKYHSGSMHKFSEVQIEKMQEFLMDNIFVAVGGWVSRRSVGVRMGADCAPLLADLLLYSCGAEFVQGFYIWEDVITCCVRNFDMAMTYYLLTKYVCQFDACVPVGWIGGTTGYSASALLLTC